MSLVFGGVMFLLGFLLIAKTMFDRLKDSSDVFASIVALFIIYCCIVGCIAALSLYLKDTGLVVYLMLLLGAVFEIGALVRLIASKEGDLSLSGLILFCSYIVMLLIFTLFSRQESRSFVLETDFLKPIEWAVEGRDYTLLYHMILNAVLFVPLGFLFVRINEKACFGILPVLGIGCLLTTVIETGQLMFHLGNCDVSDMLANIAGAAAGMFVFRVFREAKE